MNANNALRCDLRGSLPLYAITPFVLTGIVLPMVFSAVMDARAGLPRGEWSLTEAGEVFAAVLFAVDVLLLAWVLAFPLREWLALGQATLLLAPAQPEVGRRLACRVRFERPRSVPGSVRADLICSRYERHKSYDEDKKKTVETVLRKELWRGTQTSPATQQIGFTFHPPQHLLPTMGDKVRWRLDVRSQEGTRFRRSFELPMGAAGSGALNATDEAFAPSFAAETPSASDSQRDLVLMLLYGLLAIMFLAIPGLIAWGAADHFRHLW